jgi:zinc ribbon protein
MTYCMHCGTECLPGDKFCSECGEPVLLPNNKRDLRPDPKENENFVKLAQEKQAAEEYYRAVGSRHPHIWAVSGIGRAIFSLCIVVTMFFFYVVIGDSDAELRNNTQLRWGLTVLGGLLMLLFLNMIRYLFVPEVRPGSNPEMVGSKGDFWVFLLGLPLIILAILNWLGVI